MASLNTLRTKFGYVLSAIIAFALLAFIFSLKSEMGFSGTDPKVGEINSEDVLYSEYYAEYENVKRQTGATEATEQEAAQLANAAWQAVIANKLLVPGFAELGLSMSEEERMAVVNGDVPTQSFGSAFTDPTTGVYDAAYITEFLSQAATNPETDAMWASLNEQAREERAMMKYMALVRSGAFVNKLEVAEGVNAANSTFSGKWVSKSYNSLPDSLFTVTDAEVKKYYETNKALYKKSPTRTISYVAFDFDPTEQDIVDIENTALAASKEFEVAEDLKAYIRGNLNGSISNNYRSTSLMSAAEVEAIEAGQMYGPVNNNNVWTMSRAAASIVAPDTLGIRHIVLRYDQEPLADSLLTALKGGANFAQAAQAHSLYSQTAQMGGEVGVMPFSSFTNEFIAPLSTAKQGDIVKIVAGDMIQLIEVYRVTKPSTHYQMATVEYPVEASQATIAALHTDAGMFSVDAKGGIAAFQSSAEKNGMLSVKSATLTNGDRTIRTINDSRAIARWAYGAKVGDLSDVFKTEDGYVVAMLSGVDDDEYRSLASSAQSIRSVLLRDMKFAEIAKTMTGSTIDAVAEAVDGEVKEFADVKFSSQYIQGLGVEPKVVGAITLNGVEGLTAPIQGNSAAYVLEINPVVAAENPTTAEMEQARAQATVEDKTSQYVFNIIQSMANIKDLRGEFF